MKSILAVAIGIFAASLAFGQANLANPSAGTPAVAGQTAAAGQSTANGAAGSKLEFEVASIRPTQSAGRNRVDVGVRMDGSQAHMTALSIKNLISRAYGIQANLISGPDWMASSRFDIDAKLPEGATMQQIPEMLQSLLEERFGLKIHRESKDMPAYALVMGKTPIKFKETPESPQTQGGNGSVNVAVSGSVEGVSMDLGNGSSITFANDQFVFKKVSMDMLALQLARYLDRPVVNMTDLKGNYDLTLPVTHEDYFVLLVRSGANAGVALPPQAMPLLSASPVSLFDALDEQGLHLDARKLPLETVVVDHISQTPTEN
ncbi:MAG TPA: TIGR03435 family protein [Candidatus Aquilonibacter sp.]|nr:TIGR03435 family protein [Candidatus Aquilonibacter sp.]